MRRNAKYTVSLLALTTAVFLVLMRRFLFGNAVYLYTDIGSDSVASSYPILVMLSRLFQSGDFSFYTLSSGLGADTTATFLQYVNPLKALLLFFNRSTMPAGLLLQLYLGTLVTAWASFRFFLLYTEHGIASVAGGILFAFSGYSVLWSQNLSYGVCVSMFALTMFAVEAFVRKRTPARFLALTGVLALYLFTNYFFTYMTALFVIAYLPLRALFLKERLPAFLKQYFGTALAALLSLILSAVCVVSVSVTFLGSVRTSDASRPLLTFLKKGIDPRMVYACAARLFSENMTGIGDLYTGPDNYYEIAVLSVSALFFFAFFYLLYRRQSRKAVLMGALLCLAALFLPVLRYILNLNWLVMRFSFWISFLMCLAAVFFIRELLTDADARALAFSVIAGTACTALIFFGLFRLAGRYEFTLSMRTVRFFALFFAAAALFLILFRFLPKRAGALLLIAFIAAEILVMRHDTLYLRLYLTKEQFGNSAYSEDTDKAVQDLIKEDPELYRIASTESYAYANEGLVDGFNGTTLYNNTNPASLRSIAQAHGTNEVSTPYFMSGYPEYGQFTLLGGRYLIRREKPDASFTEEALFEKIASYPSKDGTAVTNVYRNKNALPFGYLLKDEISEDDYLAADLPDRMQYLTQAWYLTGTAASEESIEAPAAASAASAQEMLAENADTRRDLLSTALWTNPHNLKMEQTKSGVRFTATGEDPYIYVYLNTPPESKDTSNYLHMTVHTKKNVMRTIALYYLPDAETDAHPDFVGTIAYNKYYPESLTLLPDGIAGFRFDIDEDAKNVTLSALELVTCSDPLAHFAELKASPVEEISFKDDTYTAVVSSDQDEALLLVPFLYLSGWEAEVNGEAADVLNVCGGFTGVKVGRGTSRVTLRYSIPHFKAGLIITLAAACAYLLAWILVGVSAARRKRSRS